MIPGSEERSARLCRFVHATSVALAAEIADSLPGMPFDDRMRENVAGLLEPAIGRAAADVMDLIVRAVAS